MTNKEKLVEKLKSLHEWESVKVCGREVKAGSRYYHVGVHQFQFAEDCVRWLLANTQTFSK